MRCCDSAGKQFQHMGGQNSAVAGVVVALRGSHQLHQWLLDVAPERTMRHWAPQSGRLPVKLGGHIASRQPHCSRVWQPSFEAGAGACVGASGGGGGAITSVVRAWGWRSHR
jgi:hypothetical protein